MPVTRLETVTATKTQSHSIAPSLSKIDIAKINVLIPAFAVDNNKNLISYPILATMNL